MNYQIIINLTNEKDNYSIDLINDIYLKYVKNNKLSNDELGIINKILCYVLLIIKKEELLIEKKHIGKIIYLNNGENPNDIIKQFNLSIQTIEDIYSDNNYVFPNLGSGFGNRLFQFMAIFSLANKNNKKIAISTKKYFIELFSGKDVFENIKKVKIFRLL